MSIVDDWKQKTVLELQQMVSDLLREQFKLRLKKASNDLTQTHKFKQIKRDIARIKTLLTQKQAKG